jgi:hypothetical protein
MMCRKSIMNFSSSSHILSHPKFWWTQMIRHIHRESHMKKKPNICATTRAACTTTINHQCHDDEASSSLLRSTVVDQKILALVSSTDPNNNREFHQMCGHILKNHEYLSKKLQVYGGHKGESSFFFFLDLILLLTTTPPAPTS